MIKVMPVAALCAATLLCASYAPSAFAAAPEFCANYARAALNQARVAHSTPPCAPGAIGSRWSNEYGVHYGWCITAAPQAANAERDERTRYLRSCRR